MPGIMARPFHTSLRIVPGTLLVLFELQLDGARALLALPCARFLEGLKAACDLLAFGPVQRDDDRLDELLPWAGNV